MEVGFPPICWLCVDAEQCRAHYADGELVPAKPGTTADARPAAANDGTVINVREFILGSRG